MASKAATDTSVQFSFLQNSVSSAIVAWTLCDIVSNVISKVEKTKTNFLVTANISRDSNSNCIPQKLLSSLFLSAVFGSILTQGSNTICVFVFLSASPHAAILIEKVILEPISLDQFKMRVKHPQSAWISMRKDGSSDQGEKDYKKQRNYA